MSLSPREVYQAVNVSKGGVVLAERVDLADTSSSRRRGLLGRSGLGSGEGLYLTPCEWLHTFGMRFCIDVAFLSPSGKVLAVYHSLRPNRLSRIVWSASGALEIPDTSLRRTQTERGDVVHLLHMDALRPVQIGTIEQRGCS